MHQIFCRYIAFGAGNEGAATQAAGSGIEGRDAFFDSCIGIGQAHAVRIMEMDIDLTDIADGLQGADNIFGVGRIGNACRIAEANPGDTDLKGFFT